MGDERINMKHDDIKIILNNKDYIGQNVTICGWIKTIRKSKNISFIEVNDGTSFKNIQLIIDNNRLEQIQDLNVGASITVNGKAVKSINCNQDIEIDVEKLKVLGGCPADYPIQKKKQNMEFLREIPHLRTRTNTFNAVFKVRNVLTLAAHQYFQNNNFTYVNTPIITGSNCEGAGELFRVTTLDIDKISKNEYQDNIDSNDFLGKRVSLTLSGQLEAEAMACSFGKVYTFGPAFRAENSNTKRHAAEFWVFEPEVAFADLNDIMEVVLDLFRHMVKAVLTECPNEIDFFTRYYDNGLCDKLTNVVNGEFENLDYTAAIKMLEKSQVDFEYPVYWGSDLKYEHINYLMNVCGRPIFIMNSPSELKPFYVKTNSDKKTVASADLYFPGIGDIIGACQKEDDFELLDKKISELNMTKEDYLWYLDLRKYGTVPHSGFGLGLERMVMYITGMNNIRDTIPFPRTKCKRLKL